MKKILFIVIVSIFPLTNHYGQSRIIEGTWTNRGISLLPTVINIYPDSSFGYWGAINFGGAFETKGSYSIKNDSIFFKYPNIISPQITDIESGYDPKSKSVQISFDVNFSGNHIRTFAMLAYLNSKYTDRYKPIGALSTNGTLYTEKFNIDDTLYIHFNLHTIIMCKLDVTNQNKYIIRILLPYCETIYYLTSAFGVFKDDLMYVDYNDTPILYYNTTVYNTQRKRKKVTERINSTSSRR